jgi:hypothetical protein
VTREERRERIRQLVDAAPLLPPEDIDRLRGLLPAIRRNAAEPLAARVRPAHPTAA